MNDYNRGNSGFGSTVGADFRAQQEYNRGQQERQRRLDQERQQRDYQQRLQRESQERQYRQLNENNQQPAQGSVQAQSAGTYSATGDAIKSDGVGYTIFCVLAFIGTAIYGLTFIDTVLTAEDLKTLEQYIGADGVVSGDVFAWSYIATVTVIGILIRKILRWVIGLGILLGIVWGIYLVATT